MRKRTTSVHVMLRMEQLRLTGLSVQGRRHKRPGSITWVWDVTVGNRTVPNLMPYQAAALLDAIEEVITFARNSSGGDGQTEPQ